MPVKTFRRDGVYRDRWQYWAPWGVTRPWLPHVFRGGDEWCNDSICLVIPLLGCLVIFWRPGKQRTVPCAVEWAEGNITWRADYAPCGRYHGGKISTGKHAHWKSWPCDEAVAWLASGEPERATAREDAAAWWFPWETRS
jgi:hypothetical protein